MGDVQVRIPLQAGSQEVCWATAPAMKVQELKATLRERQARGEIRIVGQGGLRNGRASVPYVRLAPAPRFSAARRRAFIVSGAAGVYALAVLALAWEARWLLLSLAGAGLFVAGLLWLRRVFAARHCPKCPGV